MKFNNVIGIGIVVIGMTLSQALLVLKPFAGQGPVISF